MEKEGLDTNKIIKTVNNLISAKKALNYYKEKALHKHVTFLSKNKCLINKQIFIDEAKEIIFKSFSDILSLISGTYYPPRSKKVLNLIDRVKKVSFNKSTLGGCVIEKKDNNIEISKEFRVKKTGYQLGK
jgi:tRNA(Ile)-lysidine synthase